MTLANTSPSTLDSRSTVRANLETAAIGLGALMAALAQTLILPVLPTITQDLGASTTQAQWLLTSTLLAAAVSVPVIGRLADMFGRRRLLMCSLTALAIGSTIDALTDNVDLMIVGRALVGLSSSAIPLGISLLAATLPEARKQSAVGLVSAMLGVGGALGLPLAGLIGDHFDYHVLYWIGAVGALIAVVLIRIFVSEPRVARRGSFDWYGAVLLSGGLICLVLPLAEGTAWGWASLRTVGLLVASAALFVVLTVVERRRSNPLVNVRTAATPPIALTNLASVFVGFALFASFVGTSNYVQAPQATGYGFGSSVLVAGLCLLPSGLLMLVLAPVTARLIASWSAPRVLTLAGLVIAAGLVVRIVAVSSLWEVIVGASIVGAGTGIGYATLPALINAHTAPADLAAGNGLNALARTLGSTLASAVGGSLLAAVTISIGGFDLPSLSGYRVLFAICAAAALAAAGAGVLLSRLARPAAASPDLRDSSTTIKATVQSSPEG